MEILIINGGLLIAFILGADTNPMTAEKIIPLSKRPFLFLMEMIGR